MSKNNPAPNKDKNRKYDGLIIGALKLLPSGIIIYESINSDKHIFITKTKILVKRDFSQMKILIEADKII